MELVDGEKVLIIHFGELWLRGRNRNSYIKALQRNINEVMRAEDVRLERAYDRFVLRLGPKCELGRVKERLDHLFGISNYEIAYVTKSELGPILELAKRLLLGMDKRALKISAHRSYKKLPFNSVEIVDRLFKLAKEMGFPLSNKEFEFELRINVTREAAYISYEKVKASGGLPVGTSGCGVVLLSGGIDSPVAAWYAMKRGVRPVYIHVHGYPNKDEVMNSKMHGLLSKLAKYSPGAKIYYVPSYVFQAKAVKAGRYELILLKMFMMMVAERIARKEGANMIFTGESLGQVASQTPANIAAESDGIKIPILRPLIGFDKEEIIKVARRIGTYDLSILPYRDICSINSRNPKTQTDLKKAREIRKAMKLGSIVTRTMKLAQTGEA